MLAWLLYDFVACLFHGFNACLLYDFIVCLLSGLLVFRLALAFWAWSLTYSLDSFLSRLLACICLLAREHAIDYSRHHSQPQASVRTSAYKLGTQGPATMVILYNAAPTMRIDMLFLIVYY